MQEQLDLEAELQHDLARSDDFVEGVSAFVEKREANFTGS
jgi:2-(1,2-epoxy-1,2-dihydrophenyl)acetyl-CoA isomerase